MPKNRKLQNIIGTEHITDTAEAAIAAQATVGDIVGDTTPQLGGNLDVNGNDIVSVSNGDIELNPNGTGQVIFKGNATKGAGQFKLNCEQNSHGIVIKGPPHSAAASYTLTLPNTDGAANEVLKTDGSGNLDWVAQSGGGGTYEQFGDMTSIHSNFKYIYPTSLPPFSFQQTSFSSQTISDDIIFAPVLFLSDVTVSEIGCAVPGATNEFELALYSSNSNLIPVTRLHTAATISAPGTSGVYTAAIPGGNITLSANTRYYIGVTNTGNGSNAVVRTVGSAGTTMKVSTAVNRSSVAIFSGTNNSLPSSIPQDSNLAELYLAPMVVLVEA